MRDELLALRAAVEERFGPQPEHGLIWQRFNRHGPLWNEDGSPQAWSEDDYKHWAARVWRPACRAVANLDPESGRLVPGTVRPYAWVERMRFYDCRHTAASVALAAPMPNREVAELAGHSLKTLSDVYAHVIAEYRGRDKFDPEQLIIEARAQVAAHPAEAQPHISSQRDAQRRHRARCKASVAKTDAA